MFRLLTDTWGAAALRGLVALLFGITALVWLGITVTALIVLFGVALLVLGFRLRGLREHLQHRRQQLGSQATASGAP